MSHVGRTTSSRASSSQSLANDLQTASSTTDDSGSSQLSDLEDQIKTAIEEALNNFLNSSDSTSSTSSNSTDSESTDSTASSTTMSFKDFMEVIKQAVDGVLEDNGIDPESIGGQMPPPPPPDGMQAGGPPPGPPPGADSTYTNSSLGSSSSTSSTFSSDEMEKLIETLQELIAQLQNNSSGDSAVSGYLFDQVS
jgi:hypothetical protein